MVDEDGTGKPGKRQKTLGGERRERERETRCKKRDTRRVKESKTKRERERERENVQNSKEKDSVVRESKRIGRRCENEGEKERERERARVAWSRWYTSVLHSSSHSRERDNEGEKK